MPYKAARDDRCPAAKPWGVTKTTDGELMGCHASEEDAMSQVQAILANEPEARAEWDTAYINDLPDSAFACIEPGGEKDESGRTVPRSLRKYPHHNAAGDVDAAHLANARARVRQAG